MSVRLIAEMQHTSLWVLPLIPYFKLGDLR
jgi:hypothetical protein